MTAAAGTALAEFGEEPLYRIEPTSAVESEVNAIAPAKCWRSRKAIWRGSLRLQDEHAYQSAMADHMINGDEFVVGKRQAREVRDVRHWWQSKSVHSGMQPARLKD